MILGNVESAAWSEWPGLVAAIVRGDSIAIPERRLLLSPRGAGAALTGTYANDAHTIGIREHGGGLWLYLDAWPVPKYLDPTADPSRFTLRSETGAIRFEFSPGGAVRQLVWEYPGGGSAAYLRTGDREAPAQ